MTSLPITLTAVTQVLLDVVAEECPECEEQSLAPVEGRADLTVCTNVKCDFHGRQMPSDLDQWPCPNCYGSREVSGWGSGQTRKCDRCDGTGERGPK